jgi:hypothetical protein
LEYPRPATDRYAGEVVFGIRVTQPQSVAGRIWNFGQAADFLFALTAIALKLAGVITWSWWWVLSPLWISGLLTASALCIVFGLFGLPRAAPSKGGRRRRAHPR